MAKGRDRTVWQRADGSWVNKRHHAEKASSVHRTQGAAESSAKEMLERQGGGELTVIGENKKIRSKDTIAPGRDPYPPKDTEH
jgi:hypothetical protein